MEGFNWTELLTRLDTVKTKAIEYKDSLLKAVALLLGLISFCIVSTISGVLHSIPLVSNVLELVGLGYSVYFGSRYLIKKSTRDELKETLDKVKVEVVGNDPNT